MFSIYKISTVAIVAAVSASMLMSVSSVASAAEATAPAGISKASIFEAQGKVTRSEARRIVRNHLKSSGKSKLRVGSTTLKNGMWVVTVQSLQGIPVYKMKVDAVSGELSRA